jgi:hypothetical protein
MEQNIQTLTNFATLMLVYGILLGSMLTVCILAAFDGLLAYNAEKRTAKKAPAKTAAAPAKKKKKK